IRRGGHWAVRSIYESFERDYSFTHESKACTHHPGPGRKRLSRFVHCRVKTGFVKRGKQARNWSNYENEPECPEASRFEPPDSHPEHLSARAGFAPKLGVFARLAPGRTGRLERADPARPDSR